MNIYAEKLLGAINRSPLGQLAGLAEPLLDLAWRALALFTLGVGAFWTIRYGLGGVLDGFRAEGTFNLTVQMAAGASAIFALSFYLAQRPRPVPVVAFISFSLIAAAALRFNYVLTVDPSWTGDFAHYWKNALELASAERYQVDNDTFSQRALVVLTPLAEVWGDNRTPVKVLNVLFLLAVQVIGYDLLRRFTSHQAAQSFTVLWIAAPEPFLAAAIPSHDLSGLMFLCVTVWLTVRATESLRSWPAFLLMSGAATVTLTAFGMVRGIATIYLLAVACWTVVMFVREVNSRVAKNDTVCDRRWILMLCHLIVLAVGTAATHKMLAHNNLALTPEWTEVRRLRHMTPHASPLSDGSHEWMYGFHDVFSIDLMHDVEGYRAFRNSLVVSDFAEQPLVKVGNALLRYKWLFSLGDQLRIYRSGLGDKAVSGPSLYTTSYSLLFALCMLVALARLVVGRPDVPTAILLLTQSILVAICVLLTENQPRYIFPIWFVGTYLVASQWSRPGVSGLKDLLHYRNFIRAARVGGQSIVFFIISIVLVWIATSLTFNYSSGRILADFTFEGSPEESVDIEWLERFQDSETLVVPNRGKSNYLLRNFRFLSLKLGWPEGGKAGSAINAVREVCLPDEIPYFLTFHYVSRPPANVAYELSVHSQGTRLWQATDGIAMTRPVRVTIPLEIGAGCQRIVFSLQAISAPSLLPPTGQLRTEIFFPRLVDKPPGSLDGYISSLPGGVDLPVAYRLHYDRIEEASAGPVRTIRLTAVNATNDNVVRELISAMTKAGFTLKEMRERRNGTQQRLSFAKAEYGIVTARIARAGSRDKNARIDFQWPIEVMEQPSLNGGSEQFPDPRPE